jgi:hypothetical protein
MPHLPKILSSSCAVGIGRRTKAKAPPHQRVKGEGKERGCTCCSDACEKIPLSFQRSSLANAFAISAKTPPAPRQFQSSRRRAQSPTRRKSRCAKH